MHKLIKSNQKVIGLDNFSTGLKSNIDFIKSEDENNNFDFIEGDVSNIQTCLNATKNIDFILHQAALGSVPRSIKEPLASHNSNVTGTINIFNAAVQNCVKKVVYASSSSVYGDDPNLPKEEELVGKVLSPYAATKKICETYADAFNNAYNIDIIGLRYFNVFGPRQNPNGPYAAVIPLWISNILNGIESYINGDGTTSRDFTYIDNIVDLNLKAALSEQHKNSIFNGACGNKTTLVELYNLILEATQVKSGKSIELPIKFREFRAGDIKHSLARIDWAKNQLNYKVSTEVKKGIQKTVDWYYDDYIEKLKNNP